MTYLTKALIVALWALPVHLWGQAKPAPVKPLPAVTVPPQSAVSIVPKDGGWMTITAPTTVASAFSFPPPVLTVRGKKVDGRSVYTIDAGDGWVCQVTSLFPDAGNNVLYPRDPRAVTITCIDTKNDMATEK